MAYNSSKSLSLLPPEPKIFHGRDSELAQILDAFTRESPRIVILGAGGMGKTSLARAVLHHADIVPKYPDCRVFVACESASTSAELLPLLGAHIGLSAMESVTGRVVQHFANSPPTLLILDNLETVWESHSRKDVEDLLSRLSDIKHLALIVTMRGVERPDKVKWTQPFLRPLQPLSPEAARQTFLEIADSVKYTEVEIDQVLALTDNMPLAIDLIAHLVDSESCATVLSRFEGEKTSLLSEGVDRRSNLDMSISISLSSPRLVAIPSAIHLLSLLSILPDGLADAELLPSRLPVANILECKRALLRTSLAYTTNQRRLKVLVPIREHMQRHHPPDVNLVNSVFHLYRQLLELYARSRGTIESPQMASQIGSNFGNIQNVISFTMSHSSLDLEDIVSSVRMLNMFGRITGGRRIPLMTEILQQLPPSLDPDAEVGFLTEYLSLTNVKMPNIE
ncbi:P-loop containing nucleoside triphosphate hydrolase protein, partial [Mycena amicta]